MDTTYITIVFLGFSLVLLALGRRARLRRNLPYPPGPTPRFLVGNVADVPKTRSWLKFTEWMPTYGPVMHFRIFNQHILVLNTVEAANELLSHRSALYSDRPSFPMADLMGWTRSSFGLSNYGEQWRKCRRLAQQFLKADSAEFYGPIQSRKVHDLLRAFLSTPEMWAEHNQTLAAAIIMSMVYGYDIQSSTNDYYVNIAEEAASKLLVAMAPGAFAVNVFPAMQYFPSWFAFQKFAAEARKAVDAMWTSPAEFVKRSLAENTAQRSIVGTLLRKNEESKAEGKGEQHSEEILRMLAVASYAGGSHTTVSSLGTFIYAMTLNPQVVAKAQAELDRVIGVDCLPTHKDRPNLPYIDAIMRETFRFGPVAPLGLPHVNSQLDVYNGYYVPKGSIVWANIWAMTRNETVYPEPEKFIPERFIQPNGSLTGDDLGYTFGFGRRVCVGRHLAQSTIWLAMASILAAFNISQAKDIEGKEIPISHDYGDGLVTHIKPFPCTITPRSEKVAALIKEL
ncbi:cytochrome P450 [Mycena floridula]|nr:cytochrome P450 [Mycena floridula]